MRTLPDFLIIGVSRSGTTSLYNYMMDHPLIVPALWKELKFFSTNFDKGIDWYKSNFVSNIYKSNFKNKNNQNLLTGEATPHYLHHSLAPERIFKTIPKVKMIILLRNPVDRVNSDYWQWIRRGRESLSLEEGIKKQMTQPPLNYSDNTKIQMKLEDPKKFRLPYLLGGIYGDAIKNYFDIFPREQFLILKSENLFDNPETTLNNVAKFLEIPDFELKDRQKYNYNENQPKMESSIRKLLVKYYEPHNERLYKLLEKDFEWT